MTHHVARAATHESGHAVAALRFWLPLREIVVNSDGIGCTRYTRHFSWGETVSVFCGIEAEVGRFGDAPVTSDLDVIEEMIERLGLTWGRGNLDRFRQRARTLVREERRSIRVLADALLERRTMTGAEVSALLSVVTPPRSLWVSLEGRRAAVFRVKHPTRPEMVAASHRFRIGPQATRGGWRGLRAARPKSRPLRQKRT